MKCSKKRIILLAMILLLVAFVTGIRLANNRLADKLEARLLEQPLPPDTQLVDSKSIAGKLFGNGNGMQYFGYILVGSDLSEEELHAHYESRLEGIEGYDYLEVVPQKTQLLFDYYDYWFDAWQSERPSYRVGICVSSVAGAEDSLLEAILNMDIRGH